jgi:hypothetical protein
LIAVGKRDHTGRREGSGLSIALINRVIVLPRWRPCCTLLERPADASWSSSSAIRARALPPRCWRWRRPTSNARLRRCSTNVDRLGSRPQKPLSTSIGIVRVNARTMRDAAPVVKIYRPRTLPRSFTTYL